MGTTFNIMCVDVAYTWQVTGILIAMIIYSLFLLILTLAWLKRKKKVKLIGLILLYVLSPKFIGMMGMIIENMLADKNTTVGIFFCFVTPLDGWFTVLAPIVFPIVTSMILSSFLKKRYSKRNSIEKNNT